MIVVWVSPLRFAAVEMTKMEGLWWVRGTEPAAPGLGWALWYSVARKDARKRVPPRGCRFFGGLSIIERLLVQCNFALHRGFVVFVGDLWI